MKVRDKLISLFDNIRHYGTIATHAKTDQLTGEIIDIDYDESESLLYILEEMFDFDYVADARIDQIQKKLQKKLRDSKPSKMN